MTDTNIIEVTLHVPDRHNFVFEERVRTVAESVRAMLGGPGRPVHLLLRVNGENVTQRLWPPPHDEN